MLHHAGCPLLLTDSVAAHDCVRPTLSFPFKRRCEENEKKPCNFVGVQDDPINCDVRFSRHFTRNAPGSGRTPDRSYYTCFSPRTGNGSKKGRMACSKILPMNLTLLTSKVAHFNPDTTRAMLPCEDSTGKM